MTSMSIVFVFTAYTRYITVDDSAKNGGKQGMTVDYVIFFMILCKDSFRMFYLNMILSI